MASMADPRATPSAIHILVVGNTCTGKSALINKMIGEEKAEEHEEAVEDDQRKETNYVYVKDYDHSVNGVPVKFWETPGLQGVGVKYIRENITNARKECSEADLMLYCIKITNTRFQKEDHKTIMNLTEGLGKGIWEKAIFVLTFANEVIVRLERTHKCRPAAEKKPMYVIFNEVVNSWKKVLSAEVIKAGVNSRVAESIPVVPAGYEISENLYLEDDNIDWIESLWNVCKARKPQHWYEKLKSIVMLSVHVVGSWWESTTAFMTEQVTSVTVPSEPLAAKPEGESSTKERQAENRDTRNKMEESSRVAIRRENSKRAEQAEESGSGAEEMRAALRWADRERWKKENEALTK